MPECGRIEGEVFYQQSRINVLPGYEFLNIHMPWFKVLFFTLIKVSIDGFNP
jgi:hypothetical protein